MFKKFWSWYNKNTIFNSGIASGLFTLQLVHLYWLTTTVVFLKLFGKSFFSPSPTFEFIITIVDYTEIPAIIITSFMYINELRSKFNTKSLLFLIFLNSQWIHMFWITDEFVIQKFTDQAYIALPTWLAWGAILIDYLELPVIFDTLKKFWWTLKNVNIQSAFERLKED